MYQYHKNDILTQLEVLKTNRKKSINRYSVSSHFIFNEGDNSRLILFTKIVTGDRHYHFELSALHQKGYQWHFEIRSVQTSEEHKEKSLYLPFSALPKLRKGMVKILAEHDGSERIDEMPTIPEWATRGFLPIQNLLTLFTHQINQVYILRIARLAVEMLEAGMSPIIMMVVGNDESLSTNFAHIC
jgi:hypothetical protein